MSHLESTGLAPVAGHGWTGVAPGVHMPSWLLVSTGLVPVAGRRWTGVVPGFHRLRPGSSPRLDGCRAWIPQVLPQFLAAGGRVPCMDSAGFAAVAVRGWMVSLQESTCLASVAGGVHRPCPGHWPWAGGCCTWIA